jgi:hypothetical protein
MDEAGDNRRRDALKRRAATQFLEAGYLPIPALGKRPKLAHKPLPASHPGGGVPRWTPERARRSLQEFEGCEMGLLMTAVGCVWSLLPSRRFCQENQRTR